MHSRASRVHTCWINWLTCLLYMSSFLTHLSILTSVTVLLIVYFTRISLTTISWQPPTPPQIGFSSTSIISSQYDCHYHPYYPHNCYLTLPPLSSSSQLFTQIQNKISQPTKTTHKIKICFISFSDLHFLTLFTIFTFTIFIFTIFIFYNFPFEHLWCKVNIL